MREANPLDSSVETRFKGVSPELAVRFLSAFLPATCSKSHESAPVPAVLTAPATPTKSRENRESKSRQRLDSLGFVNQQVASSILVGGSRIISITELDMIVQDHTLRNVVGLPVRA